MWCLKRYTFSPRQLGCHDGDIFKWLFVKKNINRNIYFFIQEIAFQNVVYEMSAIFSNCGVINAYPSTSIHWPRDTNVSESILINMVKEISKSQSPKINRNKPWNILFDISLKGQIVEFQQCPGSPSGLRNFSQLPGYSVWHLGEQFLCSSH